MTPKQKFWKEIEFQSGSVYQYCDVSEAVYEERMSAPSHGKHFIVNIRNVYRYRRVR